MLMRLEQHLKAEEESRKNTEHLLDASLQNEMRLKSELEALYLAQKKRDTEIQQQKHQTESVPLSLPIAQQNGAASVLRSDWSSKKCGDRWMSRSPQLEKKRKKP